MRKIIPRVIAMQFKACPWLCAVSVLLGSIAAVLLTVNVIANQGLFDAITYAAMGNIGFSGVMLPLLIVGGVSFGVQITNGLINFVAGTVLNQKSMGHLKALIHRKLQRVDPALFEDTDFLDDINKANDATWIIPYFMLILIMIVTFGFYFATIGVFLFNLQPMLLVTLALAFIPALLAQLVRGKVFAKLEEESAPLRRECGHYQATICDREFFKETRILGAFKFFHNLFTDTMQLLLKKQWRAERKTAIIQFLLNGSTFVGMAIASYLLFAATMNGEISVGTFAAVFGALGGLFSVMQEIVTTHIGNLNRNVGKVTNYFRLLDMPERTGRDAAPDFSKGIIAENVSFIYPGRDNCAVKNVSFSIGGRETIAIVGENGAGKSTLVRLLTGIYCPSAGKVTLGGLDTSKAAPTSLYKETSGVLQKYQQYKMTLSENVSISDTSKKAEHSRIESALGEAGMKHEGLPLSTMLSPEFDGIDLSGGQWQRIAIARGLYRFNNFIVLDEPTAAIDPVEETRIYAQFQKLAKDKCAIIVTHRLGSAKLAKRIIVMDAGEIVDIGTHDELLSRPGKYAEMWEAQSQWYDRQAG